MTIQSGFFNSINGDRKYDASWFAQYFASFIGNGVFPNPSTGLQVVEGNNMSIVVKPGKGWINGYFVVNDSDYTLTLDNADGVLKRIDRVVMRLNYLTRQIEIYVKKGTFASNPVVPILQRDSEYYELGLSDILINNGVVQITQSNITDTRLNNELCGIVHGIVDQVDTTTIFNQYQIWLEEQKDVMEDWQTATQQDFLDWFNDLQVLLDGDVATNLTNRILQLENNVGDKNQLLTTNKTNLVTAINEVFQTGNNRKEALVDLLLSLDDSLPINDYSSWDEILVALENLSTGKKFAIGNETIVTLNKGDFYYLNGNATPVNTEYIQIMDTLDFEPSIVIIVSPRVQSNYLGFTTIAFKGVGISNDLVLSVYSNGAASNVNNHTTKLDNTNSFIRSSGFKLPITRNNNTSITSYTWLVLE